MTISIAGYPPKLIEALVNGKRKVVSSDPLADRVNAVAADGFSSPLRGTKIPKTSFISPPPRLPSIYHYSDAVEMEIKSEDGWHKTQLKLLNKDLHTLIPGSAQKDAQAIAENYSEISRKSKLSDPSPIKVDENTSISIVGQKEYEVERNRLEEKRVTRRLFTQHPYENAGKALYPLKGDDFVSLPGADWIQEIDEYHQKGIQEPLVDHVKKKKTSVIKNSALQFKPRAVYSAVKKQ